MGYTQKQYLFAAYLMNRFGVSDQKFIEKFLDYYLLKYGRWTPSTDGWSYYFDVSVAINMLLAEQNIKRNRYAIRKKEVKRGYITATDLSAFAFCPASYAINKSFEIPKTPNDKELNLGNYFHEQLNLLKRFEDKQSQKEGYDIEREGAALDDSCIQEIYDSKLVFKGHSLQNQKIFHNHETKISCVPDYIFQDPHGNNFVVEEKYHFYQDPAKLTYDEQQEYFSNIDIEPECEKRHSILHRKSQLFYLNHIIQVFAYIANIRDYKIDYGYLVYWYYDFEKNRYNERVPYIHKVSKRKVVFDEYHTKLYSKTVDSFKSFLINGKLNIKLDKIQGTKCGGCSMTQYCGHKSKMFDELTFPYQIDYLKMYNVDFPEELKKKDDSD